MAKEGKNSNILDIITGVQQAVANARDGAKDEDGKALKTGLKRDVENIILDPRVMDGFGVVFQGDRLKLTYHGEIRLEDVYESKLEKELEAMLGDIVAFLKKEYKKITGETLSLTPDKKPPLKMLIQSTSRIRAWVQASKIYSIGGVDLTAEKSDHQKSYEKRFKNWVDQQNEKPKKRPKNEEISKEDNQKEKSEKKSKKEKKQ